MLPIPTPFLKNLLLLEKLAKTRQRINKQLFLILDGNSLSKNFRGNHRKFYEPIYKAKTITSGFGLAELEQAD